MIIASCSVPCFKKHKGKANATLTESFSVFYASFKLHRLMRNAAFPAESCSDHATRAEQRERRDAQSGSQQSKASNSSSLPEKKDDQPARTLAELVWPPDPLEEGLNALDDPLNRDEPKPLLHTELMAIGRTNACYRKSHRALLDQLKCLTGLCNPIFVNPATSIPLRQLLSTHPFLKTLLMSIAKIPNAPPRYPQETRVRNVLGLGESEGVPLRLNYRPGEEAEAAKPGPHDQRQQRRGPIVDPQEREALTQFHELVKQILAEERRKRSAATAS